MFVSIGHALPSLCGLIGLQIDPYRSSGSNHSFKIEGAKMTIHALGDTEVNQLLLVTMCINKVMYL